jgi:hypothetical protein
MDAGLVGVPTLGPAGKVTRLKPAVSDEVCSC